MIVEIRPGQEFNIRATPSQALLRRLAYLAEEGTGSIATDGLEDVHEGGAGRHGKRRDGSRDFIEMLESVEQTRLAQIHEMDERLDRLDRLSEKQLREARERLERIRRNANRTKDGRLAFADTDGTIYDEHGHRVAPSEIDPATWRPDRPTWNDFNTAQRQTDEAKEFRNKVLDYRKKLNGKNLGDDDLADLDKDIATLEKAHPATSADEAKSAAAIPSTSAAKAYDDSIGRTATALQPTLTARRVETPRQLPCGQRLHPSGLCPHRDQAETAHYLPQAL